MVHVRSKLGDALGLFLSCVHSDTFAPCPVRLVFFVVQSYIRKECADYIYFKISMELLRSPNCPICFSLLYALRASGTHCTESFVRIVQLNTYPAFCWYKTTLAYRQFYSEQNVCACIYSTEVTEAEARCVVDSDTTSICSWICAAYRLLQGASVDQQPSQLFSIVVPKS